MKKAIIIISLFILATALAVTVSPTYLSFNGGQVTPLMEARADFAKYSASCRTVENMLVTVHGAAQRRSGTRYVANTKSDNEAKLVPFTVSTDDSYVLEFTNGFIRFYRDDGS